MCDNATKVRTNSVPKPTIFQGCTSTRDLSLPRLLSVTVSSAICTSSRDAAILLGSQFFHLNADIV